MERIPEGEAIAELEDVRAFNQVMGDNRFRLEGYRKLAQEAVDMGIPAGGTLLDIGTGPGFVAIEAAKLLTGTSCRVVGLDLSPSMLALAAENAVREGVDGLMEWREGDSKAMPFADGTFDCVVSNDSLHHWDDPLLVFDEIARVLKKAGRYLIRDSKRLQSWWPWLFVKTISLTIPADFRCHWWNSIRSSYTASELRAILARSRLQGWRVDEDFMDLTISNRV